MNKKIKKFNSKVIHGGHNSDQLSGAVMPPINLASTFKQNSPNHDHSSSVSGKKNHK